MHIKQNLHKKAPKLKKQKQKGYIKKNFYQDLMNKKKKKYPFLNMQQSQEIGYVINIGTKVHFFLIYFTG